MAYIKYDYLIIGQGLAGSILAINLINRGKRVMVIDNQHYQSASQVAAGIINPITGLRFTLNSNFTEHYQCATAFYKQIETLFHEPLLRFVSQLRLIKDQSQHDTVQKRQQQSSFEPLLGKLNTDSLYFKNTEYGHIKINKTAILDCKSVLKLAQQWLLERQSYCSEKMDYAKLNFQPSRIRYNNLEGKRVIFCEGHQAVHNPWLENLPFKLAKGEIITIEHQKKLTDMLSWGHWLVPNMNNPSYAKLGASFDWKNLNHEPSQTNLNMLTDSLHQTTCLKASIVKTEVGIRPATIDRNPFVGPIKQLNNAYCFNGFGSKGSLLIPYYANKLCDHLCDEHTLHDSLTRHL